jgi:hypothetical protein
MILVEGGLVLLDLAHLGSLLLDAHVLVDDADTAFLRHGDRQAGFGHGIHGGGHQRDVQFDAPGQASLQTHVLGQDLGVTGDEEDVVERQGFLADAQHGEGSHTGKWKRGIIPQLHARAQRARPLDSRVSRWPSARPRAYHPAPCSMTLSNGWASTARC